MQSQCITSRIFITVNLSFLNFSFFIRSTATDSTDVETIQDWLNSISMGQYVANFDRAGYQTLKQVSALNEDGIKEMGVTLVGHRNKINKSIKRLQMQFVNPGLEV